MNLSPTYSIFKINTHLEFLSVKQKAHCVIFLILLSIIFAFTAIVGLYNSIPFIKTVGNLYNFYDQNNQYIALITTGTSLLLLAILLKTLYEHVILICSIFKVKVYCSQISNFLLIVFAFLLVTFFLSFNHIISYENSNRFMEKRIISNVLNEAKNRRISFNLYALRLPYLYKDLSNFNNCVFTLNCILLDTSSNILVISPQDDPNYVLQSYGFKYSKISKNTGLWIRSSQFEKIFNEYNISFSSYFFTKNFDLKQIAKLNRVDLIHNKGIKLTNNSIQIANFKYLSKGMYNLSLNILRKESEKNSDRTISVDVYASGGSMLLKSKLIREEHCMNNVCNYNVSIDLNDNYHDIRIYVSSFNNQSLIINNLSIEKLP